MREGCVVGNDVVDLLEGVHPRFAERVVAPGEVGDPRVLFAAKEAAFKALSKRVPGLRFLPRQFVVRGAQVAWGSHQLQLQLEITPEYVHAMAFDGPAPHRAVELQRGDESRDVRRALCDALEPRIGRGPLHVEGRPPLLCSGADVLPIDISLSHHGRFVAWAASV